MMSWHWMQLDRMFVSDVIWIEAHPSSNVSDINLIYTHKHYTFEMTVSSSKTGTMTTKWVVVNYKCDETVQPQVSHANVTFEVLREQWLSRGFVIKTGPCWLKHTNWTEMSLRWLICICIGYYMQFSCLLFIYLFILMIALLCLFFFSHNFLW